MLISFYDFIIIKNYLFYKKIKKSIFLIDNKFISILKIKKELNWKNLICKDLKNLGSIKNKNFIYYNKFIIKNFNNNNNLSNLLVNFLSI